MKLLAPPTQRSSLGDLRTLPPSIYTGPVLWTSPDNGLWVATSRDGYLGMVEADGEAFRATDAVGTQLGLFENLADARTAVSIPDDVPEPRATRSTLLLTSAIAGSSAIIVAVITLWVTSR